MDKEKRDVGGEAVEQPAVRTTIVGGRPPGPGKGVGSVPRGIEVLVKKAAVDPEFRALLLAERSAAAAEIGLELSEAEVAMLDGVPEIQLDGIIANTMVNPKVRSAFMGRVAAVMLAALGVAAVDSGCATTLGNQPDDPGDGPPITGSDDVMNPGGGGASEGIRPDIPGRGYGAVDYGDQAADTDTENNESPVE
ncbi:MAG: hypothetical protein JSW52_02500 [Candidatus Coatesbacteria bacterium]|nr:MAG: hypothetical protein JSW52_02500 [Candidatus Coatesbacteria bacterium]